MKTDATDDDDWDWEEEESSTSGTKTEDKCSVSEDNPHYFALNTGLGRHCQVSAFIEKCFLVAEATLEIAGHSH